MRSFRIVAFGFALAVAAAVGAQPKSDKIAWSGRIEPIDVRAGESARLILTVTPKPTWHVYALSGPPGPTYTAFTVRPNRAFKTVGKAIEPAPKIAYDRGFKVDIGTHEGPASFAVPVTLAAGVQGRQKAIVEIVAQACDARTCDIPATIELPIEFDVVAGPPRGDFAAADTSIPAQPAGHVAPGSSPASPASEGKTVDKVASDIQKAQDKGLLPFLWLSFIFGLLALMTPCVWPMVPITVSFFSKRTGDDRQTNLKGAIAYCLGIMATFTALGLVVTLLFGAAGVQKLAANPYINIGLGLLFIVLALNLFGVFEIVVPSGLLNRAHAGSNRGGLMGPVLMGLTFSLTTFTCTVPFVGTLLVAAAKGSLLYPTLGMLAFSLAFAVPFFLLALFPQYLAKMPRSGSWLIAVKAYMGFLEIAAALKFLSNADLVWLIGWLTRPVFLAIWFAIFVVGGLYLLGWLLLPHGSDNLKIGPTRRLLGVATVAIGFYWLAAIEGAPMGAFTGFLPPDPYPGRPSATAKVHFGADLDAALAEGRAKRQGVFINFTGYTCTNCRTMEGEVFPKPAVSQGIAQFVAVELFTDNASPENNRNAELREKLTGASTNPTYVVLAPDRTVLKVFQGLALSDQEFIDFLKDGKQAADRWFAGQP